MHQEAGGGGGSSAILLGDILIIQARGGAGGDGKTSSYSRKSLGEGGKGGKGYINGEDGTDGRFVGQYYSNTAGRGGAGGGSDYIYNGLERVNATIKYTPGLLLLEVLEVQPTLIKSNNKYYTYQNNEFIEVEPTVENFKENSVNLSQLTTPTDRVVIPMEDGEVLEDGRLYRKTIDISKYKDIERIEVKRGEKVSRLSRSFA